MPPFNVVRQWQMALFSFCSESRDMVFKLWWIQTIALQLLGAGLVLEKTERLPKPTPNPKRSAYELNSPVEPP